MKEITKFIGTTNDDNTIVTTAFDSEKAAKEDIAPHLHKYEVTINKITITAFDVEYDEDIGSTVNVQAEVNDEQNTYSYTVQLSCGKHESQNGCWITTQAGNMEFTAYEELVYELFDVVGEAEKAAKDYNESTFKDHDTNFNCAINSVNLYARESLEDKSVTLVLIDNSHNSACDYGQKEDEREAFENMEDAMEYLEAFRTEAYQDCQGLYAYMNSNKD